jgi:hypothetical protein
MTLQQDSSEAGAAGERQQFLYRVRAEVEAAVKEAADDLQVTGIVTDQTAGPDFPSLGTLVGHAAGFAFAAVKPHLVQPPTRKQIELAIETATSIRGVNWRWTRTQAEKDAVYDAVLALFAGSTS